MQLEYVPQKKKGCPCDRCRKTCHFILMLHFAGVINLAESNDYIIIIYNCVIKV